MTEGKIVFGGIALSSGLKVYSSDVSSVNAVIQALVPSIDFQIDQKRRHIFLHISAPFLVQFFIMHQQSASVAMYACVFHICIFLCILNKQALLSLFIVPSCKNRQKILKQQINNNKFQYKYILEWLLC
eukprot:TRINITY_DN19941_c0_g1_i1.p4 TRINITY_DN19941_c0_g1~~TRINITY_DN19941_c0_g1_i1.p4  ORF type:complete len:129 (-),score=4.02 TRINITY_DN19941_c0_g1_i1:607-993(-)